MIKRTAIFHLGLFLSSGHVPSNESLFYDVAEKEQLADFEPLFSDDALKALNKTERAAADAVCDNNAQCLLDYAVTGETRKLFLVYIQKMFYITQVFTFLRQIRYSSLHYYVYLCSVHTHLYVPNRTTRLEWTFTDTSVSQLPASAASGIGLPHISVTTQQNLHFPCPLIRPYLIIPFIYQIHFIQKQIICYLSLIYLFLYIYPPANINNDLNNIEIGCLSERKRRITQCKL